MHLLNRVVFLLYFVLFCIILTISTVCKDNVNSVQCRPSYDIYLLTELGHRLASQLVMQAFNVVLYFVIEAWTCTGRPYTCPKNFLVLKMSWTRSSAGLVSVLYLSMRSTVLLFIRAPFYVLLVFVAMCSAFSCSGWVISICQVID